MEKCIAFQAFIMKEEKAQEIEKLPKPGADKGQAKGNTKM